MQLIKDIYWIRKLKKSCRLHNGQFIMISYCENPYTISHFRILNCNGEREDPSWIFRVVNHSLIGQKK